MLEGQGACRAGGQAARGSRLRERESDEEAAPREEAADAHGECRAEGRPRKWASSEWDVPGRESRGQTVNEPSSKRRQGASHASGRGGHAARAGQRVRRGRDERERRGRAGRAGDAQRACRAGDDQREGAGHTGGRAGGRWGELAVRGRHGTRMGRATLRAGARRRATRVSKQQVGRVGQEARGGRAAQGAKGRYRASERAARGAWRSSEVEGARGA